MKSCLIQSSHIFDACVCVCGAQREREQAKGLLYQQETKLQHI